MACYTLSTCTLKRKPDTVIMFMCKSMPEGVYVNYSELAEKRESVDIYQALRESSAESRPDTKELFMQVRRVDL